VGLVHYSFSGLATNIPHRDCRMTDTPWFDWN